MLASVRNWRWGGSPAAAAVVRWWSAVAGVPDRVHVAFDVRDGAFRECGGRVRHALLTDQPDDAGDSEEDDGDDERGKPGVDREREREDGR